MSPGRSNPPLKPPVKPNFVFFSSVVSFAALYILKTDRIASMPLSEPENRAEKYANR
jgi:hypothetical protein